MHILYIEDNPNDARLVKRYVDTTPHTLVIAANLEESARSLRDSTSFDLILVDILLDNQRSGYDIPRQLREHGYQGEVIAVTALNSAQDQAARAKAGFAAILNKPFHIGALADLLNQFGTLH